jgi:carbamoyltransferase
VFLAWSRLLSTRPTAKDSPRVLGPKIAPLQDIRNPIFSQLRSRTTFTMASCKEKGKPLTYKLNLPRATCNRCVSRAEKPNGRIWNAPAMKPNIILGIGGALGHDANAAILADGKIIAASQEERYSRIKHDFSFPYAAIQDCLSIAGIEPRQVDACAFAEKPLQSLIADRVAKPTNKFTAFLGKFGQDKWLNYPRNARGLFENAQFYFSWHHLSHAAAAFATSPFHQAAFLCVDGKGEDISASIGIANAERTTFISELPYADGIGLFYTLVTYYLGFDSFGSEYKLMGLAPYGKPLFVDRLKAFAATDPKGGLRLIRHTNFSWISMQNSSRALEKHLSVPARKKSEPLSDDHINIAASIQALFEEEILKMAVYAKQITGQNNLLFCGGCAQNCVAAGKILRSNIFHRIYNSPVGGDMGSALGAALVVQQRTGRLGNGKANANGFYLGSVPGDAPPGALAYRLHLNNGVHKATAQLLAQGTVVGWIRGRMELGARALGARSILADPRAANMQSTLNLKVKFRESFRPFAPAILAEDCSNWYDMDESSDYMQYTAYLLPKHRYPVPPSLKGLRERLDFQRCEVPSVIHVDYSARLQTVRKSVHPDFHTLLTEFKLLTGIPMLINTSFNVSGQPIVRTAAEAWQSFRHTDMDYLVLNDEIYRNPNDRTREEKQLWLQQFEKHS